MYDDDQRSSLVTSNVLHVDVKASEVRVTPGFMTFDQNVTTPVPTLYYPWIDDKDASHFSLHRFIYTTNTDHVCIIVQPENVTLITYYHIFLGYTLPPTILEYDVMVTVSVDTGWKTCIPPNLMRGHSGATFLAVQTPDEGEILFLDMPLFLCVCNTSLLKTLWEKEKCLVRSNFSFSHSVFYPFGEHSVIFITFEIVVCKFFKF